MATNRSTAGCINGYANAAVSAPNVARLSAMRAPPGFVFSVASMFVTVGSAETAVATFTGYDGEGNAKGTVNATISILRPTQVNLSSLGRMSQLDVRTTTCAPLDGADNDACYKLCTANGRTEVLVDNIDVTGGC